MPRLTNGEKFSFPGFLRCVWFLRFMHFTCLYTTPSSSCFIFLPFALVDRREFIQPVEVSGFYRTNFQTQDVENTVHKVPTHIYCRIGKVLKASYCIFHEVSYIPSYIFFPSLVQLEVLLTELSLDMLLFVIGKLEFAGPFSVKTSVILANCCKVIVSLISVQCFYSFRTFFLDRQLFYRSKVP